MTEYKLFIAGEWIDTKTGNIIEDKNPADGSVYALVHTAGPEELETAIVKGLEAQPAWEAMDSEKREKILLKAADQLELNVDRYTDMLLSESGACINKARGEVLGTANVFRAAAGECRRVDGGVVQGEFPGELSYWVRQPLGLVAGIGPFNFPLLLCANKVSFGLAAGNSFILKPASDTPLSGVILAEILDAAGLPKGVFSSVPGKGSVIGDKIVEDPRVRMISFTGSTAVGSQIAVKAAQHLKKYALEMGGKNPLIILKDADMDQAIGTALFGTFFHQGQVCMATGRIIVEEPIYDEFTEKLAARIRNIRYGDPRDPKNFVGPLINEQHCLDIDRLVKDAVEKGAELVCGGTHEGAFYKPTMLKGVTPDMLIFREETFGPVASVIKAKDAEEALKLCNDNDYGLSSAIMTNDLSAALKFAPKMQSGMVRVNDTTIMGSRRAPFGGVKSSGIGRDGGVFAIDSFTELKWISIRYEKKGFPPI